MEKTLKPSAYVPFDPNSFLYVKSESHAVSPPEYSGYHPFEYTGWWDECLSWHETSYIHAGLNPMPTYRLKGPDALQVLKKYCVNSFENFPIGRGKHAIMCDENGNIVHDGILLRTGEEEFETFCLWPYLGFAVDTSGLNATGELVTGKVFLYQICGPKSLEIVEAATGENLHDIKFIHFRDSRIAEKKVRILRAGMAGKLGYEVHGNAEDALEVYEALLNAGEKFGIRKIGRHAYRNTHTEGGFPQASIHYWYTMPPEYGKYFTTLNIWGMHGLRFTGSLADSPEMYFRNPVDLGWDKMIKFDHDFIGRKALEGLVGNPKRKMVSLVWSVNDMAEVWKSVFTKGQNVTLMDLVEDSSYTVGQSDIHNDKVLIDGKLVGISSGRVFSPYYREMISLCSIDTEYSEIGTEVKILWGDSGTDQKEIRAIVSRFPYVDEGRNEKIDVDGIPRLK